MRESEMGRPSKLTPELSEEICERLSREPITTVFADPKLPERQSYYNWLRKDQAFFDASARARAIAALREMDDAEREFDEAGKNEVNVPLLRERLQHCRWKVSKLLPRSYGEKLELTGKDGGPIRSTNRVEIVVIDSDNSDSDTAGSEG